MLHRSEAHHPGSIRAEANFQYPYCDVDNSWWPAAIQAEASNVRHRPIAHLDIYSAANGKHR